MAGTYLNIISFVITTIFYYVSLKPQVDSSTYSNKTSQAYIDYKGNQYLYLGVYFLLVMVVQFVVNTSIITSNCGGNISDNIGFAGFITFIPWTLIFGVIMLVLIVYPGFKSAFSDVIGYFYVSSSANKIITELLVNKDLENSLNDNTVSNGNANAIANKPYTFFSDIMKPDIQTLDDVRHPLYINGGGAYSGVAYSGGAYSGVALKKKKYKRKTQKVKKYLRKKINIRSSIRKRKY